ncbi:hypothetical protein FOA52_006679 [Chlamydomonas sp. UWO 241]|nr:hypothetical protein FOA52_006679 [Chlamydomonas sp. UWO 241]
MWLCSFTWWTALSRLPLFVPTTPAPLHHLPRLTMDTGSSGRRMEGSGSTHPTLHARVHGDGGPHMGMPAGPKPEPMAHHHDDADDEEPDDDAAEALLALQGLTGGAHVPSAPAPRAGRNSPTAGASCAHRGQPDAAHQGQPQMERPGSRAEGGGATGSSGSAEDNYATEDAEMGPAGSDELDAAAEVARDMHVDVVSEVEKGCQCWFPPLPDDELRRRGLYHHLAECDGGAATASGGTGAAENAAVLAAAERKRKHDDGGSSGGYPHRDAKAPYGMRGGGAAHAVALPMRDDQQYHQHEHLYHHYHIVGGAGVSEATLAAVADNCPPKRPRFIWTNELHNRFVAVVNQLGVKTAVPKAILQALSVEGMTRENVASHLQKYRMALKRSVSMSNFAGADNSGAPSPTAADALLRATASPALGGTMWQPPAPSLQQVKAEEQLEQQQLRIVRLHANHAHAAPPAGAADGGAEQLAAASGAPGQGVIMYSLSPAALQGLLAQSGNNIVLLQGGMAQQLGGGN